MSGKGCKYVKQCDKAVHNVPEFSNEHSIDIIVLMIIAVIIAVFVKKGK